MKLVEVVEAGFTIGIFFYKFNVIAKIIFKGLNDIKSKSGGRIRNRAQKILSMGNNVGNRFQIILSVISKQFSKANKFSTQGFFLDNGGVVFDISGGEARIGERVNVGRANFFKVFGMFQFFDERKKIRRRAFGEKFQDSFINHLMFWAIKIVNRKHRRNFRDGRAVFEKQSGKNRLFHFNVVG